MKKPRMLVLTASGKTGMPIARQLLEDIDPETAILWREDHHREGSESRVASIVVGLFIKEALP